jgi:predicted N-acetyltransferase YhbS
VITLVPVARISPEAVEQLLDRAFGDDRLRRTAYRIREGVAAMPELSFAAVEDGAMIGTIQCWPVLFTGDDGASVPMTMVGPVAVVPERQASGIGKQLMVHALVAAEESAVAAALMLIGDPEYYGRFFGFTADRTAGWRLPGPVERHRLLARGDAVPAGAGVIGPRVPAHA